MILVLLRCEFSFSLDPYISIPLFCFSVGGFPFDGMILMQFYRARNMMGGGRGAGRGS